MTKISAPITSEKEMIDEFDKKFVSWDSHMEGDTEYQYSVIRKNASPNEIKQFLKEVYRSAYAKGQQDAAEEIKEIIDNEPFIGDHPYGQTVLLTNICNKIESKYLSREREK